MTEILYSVGKEYVKLHPLPCIAFIMFKKVLIMCNIPNPFYLALSTVLRSYTRRTVWVSVPPTYCLIFLYYTFTKSRLSKSYQLSDRILQTNFLTPWQQWATMTSKQGIVTELKRFNFQAFSFQPQMLAKSWIFHIPHYVMAFQCSSCFLLTQKITAYAECRKLAYLFITVCQ